MSALATTPEQYYAQRVIMPALKDVWGDLKHSYPKYKGKPLSHVFEEAGIQALAKYIGMLNVHAEIVRPLDGTAAEALEKVGSELQVFQRDLMRRYPGRRKATPLSITQMFTTYTHALDRFYNMLNTSVRISRAAGNHFYAEALEAQKQALIPERMIN